MRAVRSLAVGRLAVSAAICVAVSVSVLGAAGCGRRGTPVDDIVLLTEAPLGSLDPRFAVTTWEVRVSRLIAPALPGPKDRGLDGQTPGLAASFVTADDRTHEVTLRPDARFSDGSPVTAADVKHTFDSLLDPGFRSPWRKAVSDFLAAVEVIDAGRVRFRLKTPRASFLSDIDFGIVARHGAGDFLGAGPFRLASRDGDTIVLERNAYAHAPLRAAARRLIVRTIRDDNARVLALMGGSGDLVENGMTPVVLETLESHPKLAVAYGRSATATYLGFNLEDPILRDVRVRRAIAHAIDRDRIVAAKFRGRALVAGGLLDRGNPFFAAATVHRFDPAEARRLLDEAGHRDPDGAGPRPRFTLTWKSSANRFRVALAQVMARQLAAVGIAVDVRPFDFATFMDDVRHGRFQLFTLQFTDVVEPDVLRAMFHSARIPPDNPSGLNRFRYRNAEVDEWLEQASAEGELLRRRTLYARVQETLARELPALPLWHEDDFLVHRRALRGARLIKTGRLEGLLAAVKTEEGGL